MKQKILLGIIVATVLFMGAGLYIVSSIDKGTAAIDNLVMLHQVEILREHLLLRVKGVQINLMSIAIEGGSFEKMESTIASTAMLSGISEECTRCHHAPNTTAQLKEMHGYVLAYQRMVTDSLKRGEQGEILVRDIFDATMIGDEVIQHVEDMIMGTSQKLESHTRDTLTQVSRMKWLVGFLLLVGPVFTMALGYVLMRSVTHPIHRLLKAIRMIEGGDLGSQVTDLKDEFRVVGDAFNRMARSLREQMARAQASEERYRALFHNAGDAVFVFEMEGDNRGRIVEANKAAAAMHGYTQDELIGLNIITDLDVKEDADLAPARMERIARGEWVQAEIHHRRKDGSVFPMEISAGVVEVNGKRHVLAFDRDITERKKNERRLRLFSEAVEAARDGIQLVGLDGKILYSNSAIKDIYGFTPAELEGRNVGSVNADPDLAEREIIPGLMQSGEWEGEVEVVHKDGNTFPIFLSTSVVRDARERPIALVGIIRDITERKQMERLLIEAKDDWEDTFDTITDMITIHDTDFNIIRANRAARERLGLPPLGKTEVKCYHYYHGLDQPQNGCICMHQTEETSEIYEPHLKSFLELRGIPRYKDKRLIGHIHIARDVTERRRAQRALQRAERMEMVGVMAAGLAHEIKNPLAGIKISMEVLVDELELGPEDKALFSKVIDEIRRIETLMKGLLDFARPPKPKAAPVPLSQFLDRSLAFVAKFPQFSTPGKSAITIRQEYSGDLPTVLIDEMQMQQVFMNLVYNAMNVMEGGGTLTISAEHDEEKAITITRFKDTGPGIPEENLRRIFQPFFTTCPKGTGLGLSISRQLVEQHGGALTAENNPEGGAVFALTLPVAERSTLERDEA